MKTLGILFLSLVFLSGCEKRDNELPAGLYGNSFKLLPDDQALLLEEMKQAEIKYRLDENGWIQFMMQDQTKVYGLTRKILNRNESPDITQSFIVPQHHEIKKYETAFAEVGIPYQPFEANGLVHLAFDNDVGQKVDQVRQELDIFFLERMLKRAEAGN